MLGRFTTRKNSRRAEYRVRSASRSRGWRAFRERNTGSRYRVLGTGRCSTSRSSVRSALHPDRFIQAPLHRVSRKHGISNRVRPSGVADVDAVMLELVEVAAGLDVAAQ